ncbi:group II intron reverse transcriptase/maturase [Limosilactobacillus panis]|uniref:group II intron reverse transcriptase/maturase n=1 Tax=Limosilactobacillus panis TaxID=47493 RepID=UPI001C967190|nr:group II intron reverse transcriptase/maturase [Limosilactobacillus panis]QZN92881.1 group II intron reverse transcriptase/maturase [Limosilactobacillus panis]
MRQSQKTEPQADRLSRIGLENRKYTRARSTDYGEGKGMSVTIQDQVLDRNNLNQAYLRVKRNKGAAGIDDMTVDGLLQYLRENKTELITNLREGNYKPVPVKRVEIPKPNGVVKLYNQGYRRVVDLDLKAYFDNVNHDLMIKYLQQYINDPWTLRLIRKFLTSGVLDHGLFARSDKGTPQGGPLSPLLANIYLNELDKELTRRGHHFVRYADDCNIYVKSQRAGERVMRSITHFLEKQLKVKVNPDKTKVGSPLRLKFLGFSLGVDRNGAYARPAKQSQKRVKQALKLLTKRNRGVSIEQMFEEIHRKMRGWLQYYSIGKLTGFIQRLDQWLRARIRQYIWKQWKKFKTKITNLQRLGLSYRDAYVFASTRKGYWRTAHSKTLSYSLTNRKLEHLGLINMSKTLQSIQSD